VPKCARRFSSYPPSKPADFDWVRFNLTLISILTDTERQILRHPGLDLVPRDRRWDGGRVKVFTEKDIRVRDPPDPWVGHRQIGEPLV